MVWFRNSIAGSGTDDNAGHSTQDSSASDDDMHLDQEQDQESHFVDSSVDDIDNQVDNSIDGDSEGLEEEDNTSMSSYFV